MMDLVMGRTENEIAPETTKGNPELRMLEMADRPEKNDEQDVLAIDCKRLRRLIEQPCQHTGRAADENSEHPAEDDVVDRMVSEIGERGQNVRCVMEFVKFP